MKYFENFGDERQLQRCIHCGGSTGTRDHVPSKVFLDAPYPDNLPVVPACQPCNSSFSKHEDYLALLIECVKAGSASESDLLREKATGILRHSAGLKSDMLAARQKLPAGGTAFTADTVRVRRVVLKLARGHAAYELNEPQLQEPTHLGFEPLPFMSDKKRDAFESPPASLVWPEVGSRAMQRLVCASPGSSSWIVVQPGRYRYLAVGGQDVLVRVVINEYLAAEVLWQ